ncbi:MAG TPA: phosphotransferase [Chthonomonadaceae bacterium]|nr:phosphotransferase [Chthonomonadaceae bacterium]
MTEGRNDGRREGLDPKAILAALGVSGAQGIAPVPGGQDTAIWRVEREDGVYALRVFRAEQAETCRRELAAMQCAAAGGISVPIVHAAGTWQDRPALLLSWCSGQTLLEMLETRPQDAARLSVLFGQMHAQIHRLTAHASVFSPSDWIGWAGSSEQPLQTALRALPLRPDALLHLDYHPLNVLADGERITAVLDWANAGAGDLRADAARTLSILRLAPVPTDIPNTVVLRTRRLIERGWRRGYEQVAGPLGDLTPFFAWAGAVMERDLRPRLGRPGIDEAYLARIRRWTAYWKHRMGI